MMSQPGQAPVYGQPGMNQNPMMSQPGMPPMAGGAAGVINLVKGQNMSLTKQAPTLTRGRVGLGWDVRQTSGAAFDLDASVFLLGQDGRVANQSNFIFYNNLRNMNGSVQHMGDNLTGQGEGDDEQVAVDLPNIPPDIHRVVFVVTIYEADQRMQNFGMVQRAFIRLVDANSNQEVVRFDLTEEASQFNTMMIGELYRYGPEWKFKALGQGLMGGLRAVGAQFGMQLA